MAHGQPSGDLCCPNEGHYTQGKNVSLYQQLKAHPAPAFVFPKKQPCEVNAIIILILQVMVK